MFNVAVLTPTTGICRMGYAQSMIRLAMYFSQARIFDDEPTQCFIPDSIEGSGIGANYEQMVLKRLEDKEIHWTHFLSVEDDMCFPHDALHRLAKWKVPIVGANYSTNKGEKQKFTSMGLNNQRCVTSEDSTGLEEVRILPQGFTLVAREVYEKLERPWYLSGYCTESGAHTFPDQYFSEKAAAAGFKLYVDHDISKEIIHVGVHNYTFRDVKTEKNNGNSS